ncbi:hypothetical protein LTR37_005091 [Vermiconidia calcicola]|uniref:Uncharacterized protein n=1 Tax=Vermiconidia calcicola TaxID=1690605 RepID=A0ACC3NM62_9PEZI|nr:hypothetical protein LTR37_005091 [Vermiconidia calcicola]
MIELAEIVESTSNDNAEIRRSLEAIPAQVNTLSAQLDGSNSRSQPQLPSLHRSPTTQHTPSSINYGVTWNVKEFYGHGSPRFQQDERPGPPIGPEGLPASGQPHVDENGNLYYGEKRAPPKSGSESSNNGQATTQNVPDSTIAFLLRLPRLVRQDGRRLTASFLINLRDLLRTLPAFQGPNVPQIVVPDRGEARAPTFHGAYTLGYDRPLGHYQGLWEFLTLRGPQSGSSQDHAAMNLDGQPFGFPEHRNPTGQQVYELRQRLRARGEGESVTAGITPVWVPSDVRQPGRSDGDGQDATGSSGGSSSDRGSSGAEASTTAPRHQPAQVRDSHRTNSNGRGGSQVRESQGLEPNDDGSQPHGLQHDNIDAAGIAAFDGVKELEQADRENSKDETQTNVGTANEAIDRPPKPAQTRSDREWLFFEKDWKWYEGEIHGPHRDSISAIVDKAKQEAQTEDITGPRRPSTRHGGNKTGGTAPPPGPSAKGGSKGKKRKVDATHTQLAPTSRRRAPSPESNNLGETEKTNKALGSKRNARPGKRTPSTRNPSLEQRDITPEGTNDEEDKSPLSSVPAEQYGDGERSPKKRKSYSDDNGSQRSEGSGWDQSLTIQQAQAVVDSVDSLNQGVLRQRHGEDVIKSANDWLAREDQTFSDWELNNPDWKPAEESEEESDEEVPLADRRSNDGGPRRIAARRKTRDGTRNYEK